MQGLRARLHERWQKERLRPDLSRAARCVVAFMVPILAAQAGWLPIDATFAGIAAQNIALVDIRGPYPLRIGLLLSMSAVLAGSTWLGSVTGGDLGPALVGTLMVTVAGGAWRHLSVEYGPPLAVSSALLFLIALSRPAEAAAVQGQAGSAAIGALWGVIVQVALWPIRAQHPRRRAVAESWVAVADLAAALEPDPAQAAEERHRLLAKRHGLVRTALDHAAGLVNADAGPNRRHAYLRPLEDLNTAAARLATRLIVLNIALEGMMERKEFDALAPGFSPLFTSFRNTARSIALAIVSRQPSHVATCEVRLKRLGTLLQALPDRVSLQLAESPDRAQLIFGLRQIADQLVAVEEALRLTCGRADEKAAFPLELFDVQTWTLRPLASALSLHWPPEPAMLRFVARLTVLELLGVAMFIRLGLERGYWLPLTTLVVLQPDYGATRLKAGQRFLGTLAGGVAASGLLALVMRPELVLVALGVTMAGFAFWLKRNYAIAVFFITLFVVLITETTVKMTFAVTLERLTATALGGALALVAAQLFWPVWERQRFPALLAAALRANRVLVREIGARMADGRGYEAKVIAAKHDAEVANGMVFASLQRMSGDPRSQRARMESAATLANGNQRVTRALTAAAVQLAQGRILDRADVTAYVAVAGEALESLASEAGAVRRHDDSKGALRSRLDRLALAPGAGAAADEQGLLRSLARSAVELSAMLVAAEDGGDWLDSR